VGGKGGGGGRGEKWTKPYMHIWIIKEKLKKNKKKKKSKRKNTRDGIEIFIGSIWHCLEQLCLLGTILKAMSWTFAY
jgi:hypothetical protein